MLYHKDIVAAFSAVIPRQDGLVVVHSSLPNLGLSRDSEKWEFVAAIKTLANLGHTIVVPSFTFSFCNGKSFHFRDSPSETGVLGDWTSMVSGAVRTAHPIYSYVAVGPKTELLMAATNESCFGDGSALDIFERENATIVMMGCDWQFCTQFHRYEEIANVPYRYRKTFEGTGDFGAGAENIATKMFVRDLEIDPQMDFSSAINKLETGGTVRSATVGAGTIEAAQCEEIAGICNGLLAEDPYSFVRNGAHVSYRLRCREKAKNAPLLKLAVVGSENLDLLGRDVLRELETEIPARTSEVYVSPYGQTDSELLNQESALSKFDPGVVFCLDRAEAYLAPSEASCDEMETRAFELLDRRLGSLAAFSQRAGAECYIGSLVSTDSYVATGGHFDSAALVQELNAKIMAFADDKPRLHVLDMADLAKTSGGELHDRRMWFMGRLPFSNEFSRRIARKICGLMMAETGQTARLIVVDLDNTLWGQVLGEDGIEGIEIGGDFPGNAYADFQRILKQLSEQKGIALAICSKNDEDHAKQAFAARPEQVLAWESFVSHKVNWTPKWRNIVEISEEMDIGLENILFIDDNRSERAHIEQQLPMVRILDLPDDPTLYSRSLLVSPFIENPSVTEEDKKRVASYRARGKVREMFAKFENIEEFYASLETTLFMEPVSAGTLARVVQLINKTNQFNATSHRYSADQIETMSADPGVSVLVIGSSDRFSQRENIGVLIVKWDAPTAKHGLIDTFLLSCRVLGRGIEAGILGWLADEARRREMISITGQIVETERNSPIRRVFADHQFLFDEESENWVLELSATNLSKPVWITYGETPAEPVSA